MTRYRWRYRLWLLPVIFVCLTGAPSHADEVVARPEWSTGDWWEIGRYRFTVSGRKDDTYEMIRTPKGKSADRTAAEPYKVSMDIDGWISERVEPGGSVSEALEDKKHDWVRFPLSVGSRWMFYVLGKARKTGGSQRYDYECSAATWEDLAVARRHVRSLRIECQSWTRTFPTHRASHTVWYAPEAKRYVRLVSHYTGGPTLNCSAWSVRP